MVLYHAEQTYASCIRKLPIGWDTREHFDKTLRKLDRTSSPGWPLCKQASTIGDWLYPGSSLEPDPMKAEQLWAMVRQVFEQEYEHFFKVFIKPEPHKEEKARTRRWRLIMASSLPVQIAWHMAMGHLEESFLKEQPFIPLAYGEPFFAGSWQRFKDSCTRTKITWATDKKAWDWNSPGWVYRACCELRKRLTRFDRTHDQDRWLSVVGWLYDDAYCNSKLLLATGHVYQQSTPGLMKSGLVPTISDNSLSQDLIDMAAQLSVGRLPCKKRVTGDDVIQEKPADPQAYILRVQSFGCKIKQAATKLEFMGFDMDNNLTPIYPQKHLWNFLHQKEEYLEQVVGAYLRIYANSPPHSKFWREVAERLNLRVMSPSFYSFFMNNPEAAMKLGPVRYREGLLGGAGAV